MKNIDHRKFPAMLAAIAFLTAFGPLNCTKSNNPPAANEIQIENIAFNPAVDTVDLGATVTWINLDAVDHEVHSGTPVQPDSFFHGPLMAPGDSFSFTFDTTGSFPYYCVIHTTMTGTIVVK